MKPTIYTIAQEAGVSIATVSRAFNNHSRISEETKKRIFMIAEALGYYPSLAARNLANCTTETIALILPQTSDPFFSELIRGTECISKGRHYHLLIYTSHDLDEEDSFLSLLPARVDGMVLGAFYSTGEYINQLYKQKFPFVLLGETVQGLDINTIRPDNQEGAYQLTRHLIEQHDYKKIAYICGPEDQIHSLERLLGYQLALQEHNIAHREEWIVKGKFNEASGYECTRQLLSLPDPPRSIFAGNDLMAIGAMAAANEMGYSIPEDIAIVGFDNVPSAQYLQPALTTVSTEIFEQGKKAVEQLFACIANPETPYKDIIMPTPLILRRSCGCYGAKK
jgi:DNA-binding LacI/PurR family transcriptional regulator